MKLILYLIPNGRLTQATFYQFSQSGAMCHTNDTRPHRHIVKYAASGQDIRLLEDHADMLSHMPWLDGPGVNVEAINQHSPLHTSIWHLLMHAIETADESRLATPRRPDHRSDRLWFNREIDIKERLLPSIPGIQMLYSESHPMFPPFSWAHSHSAPYARPHDSYIRTCA